VNVSAMRKFILRVTKSYIRIHRLPDSQKGL
jgi:hypothetical protein